MSKNLNEFKIFQKFDQRKVGWTISRWIVLLLNAVRKLKFQQNYTSLFKNELWLWITEARISVLRRTFRYAWAKNIFRLYITKMLQC